MFEFLEGIGSASVWPFWVPVVVWTGLAGVAAFVLGRVRGLHPIAGYRLRQALLLSLPVSVLAAPWVPGLLPAAPAPVGLVPSVSGVQMAPSVSGGIALGLDPGGGVDISSVLLGAAMVAFVLLAIWRLAILATDLRQLRSLRQVAARVDDPAARQTLRKLAEQLGVRRPVELLEGPPGSAPMTFGAWRPVIMVPRALLGSTDSLRTVLAHELIHIRRADYSWALLDCVVSATFAFHPLVWLLRRGIERCRETSCDAEVLARGFVHPKPYAELLAHTHTPTQFPMPAVAASLSAPSLKLKERLETMKSFAHKRLSSRQRVGIVLGAGLVCLVIAIAGACATRTEEDAHRVLTEPSVMQDASPVGEPREITEYLHRVEPGSVGDTLVYRIPPPIGTGIQYYPEATEQEVMETLRRLSVQIQYLREQIEETRNAMSRSEQRDQEYHYLWQRHELLRSMHTEHVKVAEITKLQYETEKRMRNGS